MARDKFHNLVRNALEIEGWTITNDPLTLKIGTIQVQIDLGAERVIAAQKGDEKIAVEIKTFGSTSFITALYEAIGKYIVYRNVLETLDAERTLFLAVPNAVHKRFFEESILLRIMKKEKLNLLIYDEQQKTIAEWIK